MNLDEQIARVNEAAEHTQQAYRVMAAARRETEPVTLESRAIDEVTEQLTRTDSWLFVLRRTLERRRDEIAAGR